MSYTIDNLKDVLEKINGDLWDIIYTEHCLEKLEHRLIDFEFVEMKLLEEEPAEIKKFPHMSGYFTLTFKSGDCDVSVVVSIFNLQSLIIISAVCGG
ncbi:MAG: hypothetical protein IJG09_04575 [Methanobrevibacter sp.]|nr:hypothetical protein [Methanobrevibacter sp.]